MTSKPCNQTTIEIHKIAQTNDDNQEFDHSKSSDDKNKTQDLSKDDLFVKEVKDVLGTSFKIATKDSYVDKSVQSTGVSQPSTNGNSFDIQFSDEAINKTQSVTAMPVNISDGLYACNSEVRTVENPLYLRVTHQGISNNKIAQKTKMACDRAKDLNDEFKSL